MLSAFGNENMPPLMSPESETPSMLRQGMANMKQNMADPKKQGVMNAMLTQSLSKIGKGFSAQPMNHQATQFDQYGNPIL